MTEIGFCIFCAPQEKKMFKFGTQPPPRATSGDRLSLKVLEAFIQETAAPTAQDILVVTGHWVCLDRGLAFLGCTAVAAADGTVTDVPPGRSLSALPVAWNFNGYYLRYSAPWDAKKTVVVRHAASGCSMWSRVVVSSPGDLDSAVGTFHEDVRGVNKLSYAKYFESELLEHAVEFPRES